MGNKGKKIRVKGKRRQSREIANWCCKEKEGKGWSGIYGQEREKYYNRNGWGIEAKEIKE